jgi:hypothetical protein
MKGENKEMNIQEARVFAILVLGALIFFSLFLAGGILKSKKVMVVSFSLFVISIFGACFLGVM